MTSMIACCLKVAEKVGTTGSLNENDQGKPRHEIASKSTRKLPNNTKSANKKRSFEMRSVEYQLELEKNKQKENDRLNELRGWSNDHLMAVVKNASNQSTVIVSESNSFLAYLVMKLEKKFPFEMQVAESQCFESCDCDISGPFLAKYETVCCHSELFRNISLQLNACFSKNPVTFLTFL